MSRYMPSLWTRAEAKRSQSMDVFATLDPASTFAEKVDAVSGVPVSLEAVTIAIMGATGTGKTSFINLVSGSELKVGEGLQSCTDAIQLSDPFYLDRRLVTLIDTPGFDDSTKSDTDILGMIAAHLVTQYKNNRKLAGIIYLHRITDTRVTGTSARNIRMFRRLCGEETLQNVAVVTTMWEGVTPELGSAREEELKNEERFFKPILEKGGSMQRHERNIKSAQSIIRSLLDNHPLPLRIQQELVDQDLKISETMAGIEIATEMQEQQRRHEKEMQDLKRETEEAMQQRDEAYRQELDVETRALEEKMRQFELESSRLASTYEEQKAEVKRAFEEASAKAEQRVAEYRQEIESLQAQLNETMRSVSEKEALERRIEGLTGEVDRLKSRQHMGCSIQ